MARLPSLATTIRAHGLIADKRLGQHFLVDPTILARVVDAAAPLDERHVLEIGPGPGGLTRALLASPAAGITAIEADRRCVAVLGELVEAAAGRLVIVEGDALDTAPQALVPPPSVIVANLPYNIGTELIVRWLRRPEGLSHIVVMLQREVAARLTAQPATAAYGRLSVLAQWRARVQGCFDLPPGAFTPPPKVHSRVVRLDLEAAPIPDVRLETLERVTKAAFGQRRKMLKTSLKMLTRDVPALCAEAAIDPSRRAETLSLAEFGTLAKVFEARAAPV